MPGFIGDIIIFFLDYFISAFEDFQVKLDFAWEAFTNFKLYSMCSKVGEKAGPFYHII